MTTKLTITDEEYANAIKFHSHIPLKNMLVNTLVIAIFLLIGTTLGAPRFTYLIFGISSIIIIIKLFSFPFILRRVVENQKAIQKIVSVQLEDKGVLFSTSKSNYLLTWEEITKWKQNENLILLYFSPQDYFVLPKYIENSGFNLLSLTKTLENKVGKEKQRSIVSLIIGDFI